MQILSKIVLVALAVISLNLTSANIAFAESGQRSVAVLSDVPLSLELSSHNGHTMLMQFNPTWERTSRGYETTIIFPVSFARDYPSLQLTRSDGKGWSRWHPEHLQWLRHSNVGRDDPACVGGKNWCAVRGL